MMPAEVHQMLERYVGSFDLTMTMWMQPDQEPVKVKIQSTHQMILGGRFLEIKQHGEMMEIPFEAVTTIGYNTSSKKMELITQTNMGTGTLYLSGDFTPTSDVAYLTGKLTDPQTKKGMAVMQRITFNSADQLLIENFDGEGNKAAKTVEYLFTRKS